VCVSGQEGQAGTSMVTDMLGNHRAYLVQGWLVCVVSKTAIILLLI